MARMHRHTIVCSFTTMNWWENVKQNKIEELQWHVTHFAVLRNSILPRSHFVLFPLAYINGGGILWRCTLRALFRRSACFDMCPCLLHCWSTIRKGPLVKMTKQSSVKSCVVYSLTFRSWFPQGELLLFWCIQRDGSGVVWPQCTICVCFCVHMCSPSIRSSWAELSDNFAVFHQPLLRLAIHHY